VWAPSKAAALRAAKRRSSIYPAIDLMPFLGVFLVLLIIFMLVPTSHGGLTVDLPNARSAKLQPGAVREDAIRISVARNGSCYFRLARTKPGELPDLIRTAMRDGSERKVYLSADSRAKNGDVTIVVDQIRLAGIINVVILANKPPRSKVEFPSRD
jgi:biopolymer transport protein TolR